MFEPLPPVPDHPALEQEILDLWDVEGTFAAVQEKNADGPRFSFIDGPVTANKSLAVHTTWGRTLKDVFQRYKALRGFHQRYQNGFDCQGLWIEVGVEKELGLNSKRDIEAFGLAEFAQRCREVVERSAREITRGSIRLGQWMDWENSYYTFSDINITYIWQFLKQVHDQGRLYVGHRATEWCPRCGTSVSAHELIGSYVDQDDPSLFVRFPLRDRPGESLVVWTTTPWTLPANVAAAVNSEARYGLHDQEWRAIERTDLEDEAFDAILTGAEMVGWRYEGPYDDLSAERRVEHRVIAWDDVSVDEGTGVVHIAPGCGSEDFALSQVHDLPVVTPVDESGLFYPDFGWLAGSAARASAPDIIDDLQRRGFLVDAGTVSHRYPECWRCHTPLIFRISDDWFIRVDDKLRQQLRDANATIEWTPAYMGKRMDDWLVNMGDWNISRRRYYGLPLPFYRCACGWVTVVGSKDELSELAVDPIDGLPELRRPWIDDVRIRCLACGDVVSRIPEVGDVWLDAGIVPFSTLGWKQAAHVEHGQATGAAAGLTGADLPDQEYWEQWFPAEWVSEMREQIRLWFYSQLFMSVVLVGRAPFQKVLGYEKMLDETGLEMHGSWGNMIEAEVAFERMGADVMRWQFCQQPPSQNLLFGFGPAADIKRKLLTLWNSVSFLVQYSNIAGVAPRLADLDGVDDLNDLTALDGWIVARTHQLVVECEAAFERYITVDVLDAFESYVDGLSNWYIRRSRRRFWDGDEAPLRVLWWSITTSLRVIAPILPFLSEHLWRRLVSFQLPEAPTSVFLAGWPQSEPPEEQILADVGLVRVAVELGRQARAKAGIRLRQPLSRAVIEGMTEVHGYVDEIASELRVKQVELGTVEATQLRVQPKLPVLGPRLGGNIVAVRRALEEGRFVLRDDGGVEVEGFDLSGDDVLVERTDREGWAVAARGGVTIALDLALDEELELEARVHDLIHHVNTMRKEKGCELADRIALHLPAFDEALLVHSDWIAREVLAVAVDASSATDEVSFERVDG